MKLVALSKIDTKSKKLLAKVSVLENLLGELENRDIPVSTLEKINIEIEKVNSFIDNEKLYAKILSKSLANTLNVVESELSLFAKNHYRKRYMALGMAFGVAFGSAFGASQNNMGLMPLGLPLGMAVGIYIGKVKDGEVFKSGNQLGLEV